MAGLALAAVLALVVLPTRLTPSGEPEAATAIAARANDFYFQYTRAENEAAIELFERLIGTHPRYAPAYAGLANALVQRVLRWPGEPGSGRPEFRNLRTALAAGHLREPEAVRTLERAEALARQAVALAPEDAEAHKALGFAVSARGSFEAAIGSYRRAIALDADAWGALLNLADVLEIEGRADEALPYLEQAYAAMGRVYARETPRVQPWYAEAAVAIGDRHQAAGRGTAAETWYRRALEHTPLHAGATRGLADVLRAAGDAAGADQLCRELAARVGQGEGCSGV